MSNHLRDDHEIHGAAIDQMRGLLARHLCGWITGHNAPLAHFLVDADLILNEADSIGIRFHLEGDHRWHDLTTAEDPPAPTLADFKAEASRMGWPVP
jgi:hypothetical protein